MPKQQRSIGLSSDIIRFVEEHRGSFSFSAYTEYLIREGIHSLQAKSKPEAGVEEGTRIESRRAIIRAR